MIFFLEIEGVLKQCEVKDPYCSMLQQWNAVKSMLKVDSEGFEFAKDALNAVARECVQAGAYEVMV